MNKPSKSQVNGIAVDNFTHLYKKFPKQFPLSQSITSYPLPGKGTLPIKDWFGSKGDNIMPTLQWGIEVLGIISKNG